jgi:4-amino-4-deoxy-L-arabinose transferase-like glycosyltransferase
MPSKNVKVKMRHTIKHLKRSPATVPLLGHRLDIMLKIIKSRWAERIFLLFMLCASLFLFLANLGNQNLWQDEAQTAVISKTILTHGLPVGYDGKNYFSQELGAEYGKNYIWKWHTWLPFYLLAAFFKLFGTSTFVARLPFALFGIGSVFMTYWLCKVLWHSPKIAVTAAILLLFSVPFLVLSRQCRYYSLAAFFSLWSLVSYAQMLDRKKYAGVGFVLSTIFLFHTHYIYYATLFATVFTHTILFHRQRFKQLSILSAISILVNLPWVIWLAGMKYGQTYVSFFNTTKFIVFGSEYISWLTTKTKTFPPLLLLLIPVICIANRIKTKSFFSSNIAFWQKLLLLLFFVLYNLITLAIASPRPFFRYLAPLVAPTTIVVAILIVSAARLHWVVSVAIIAILISTGSFADFIYELTHDFDGPIDGIVKFLNENGSENDVVTITYGDMPLKFYTKMRIVGGLTGEDLSIAKQAKWVILRKYFISEKDFAVRKYLLENIPWHNYRPVVINYPDTAYENRENLDMHHFRTVLNESRVVIYQRVK